MTTSDIMLVMAPFFVVYTVMLIGFGITHYMDVNE